MIAAILALIIAVLSSTGHTGASHATLAPCVGSVVTVHGDDPVGCDLTPPQRLDITGITIAECDDMGGEPIALTPTAPVVCEGVSY